MKRTSPLCNGSLYHIFNKSIAGYIIFNNQEEYARMLLGLQYYLDVHSKVSFSILNNSHPTLLQTRLQHLDFLDEQNNWVTIIAYCLMPTHFHLILKQNRDEGISRYLGNIQNSYSKFFNSKHQRKGPLWVGRFKNILINSDEQLLHLTRYLHLNPTSAALCDSPEDWPYSSYHEYLGKKNPKENYCNTSLISLNQKDYRSFVNGYKDEQRERQILKSLQFD